VTFADTSFDVYSLKMREALGGAWAIFGDLVV
jgi:hypothetical protein